MHKAAFLANFTIALTKAFQVLENVRMLALIRIHRKDVCKKKSIRTLLISCTQHRRDHLASMCNQAIMLITDGVPDSYADIYRRYNWKNLTEPPFPVRVFTYLIGRDGVDFRDTRWMACANHGEFKIR